MSPKLSSLSQRQCLLAFLFIALVGISYSHDPTSPAPTEEEIAQMKQTGEWDEAKRRLGWLKQYRMQSGVNARAFYKIDTEAKLASGMTETEIARAFGERAFPYLNRKPELKSSGGVKTLTLLIDFRNHRANDELPGMSVDGIRSNIYGQGTTIGARFYPFESVKKYYERASEGQVTYGGTVFPWYTFAKDRATYEPEDFDKTGLTDQEIDYQEAINNQKALFKLFTEALDDIENSAAGHDFSQYDNDGDGDIDLVTILYAGPPGSWSSFWWAYRWEFFIRAANNKRYDGKRLKQFVFQFIDHREGEETDFDPTTLIHETGHAFGLPDYYDYDAALRPEKRKGPDGGVGGLDIMDGNWGNHNCFSRWLLDWVDPLVIGDAEPKKVTLVSANADQPGTKAVAIFPGITNQGAPNREMFMIEYRDTQGNDGGQKPIPNSGLLIWKVDGTPNSRSTGFTFDNSYTSKKLIQLIRADREGDFANRERATSKVFFVKGKEFSPITVPGSGTTGVVVSNLEFDDATRSVTAKIGILKGERLQDLLSKAIDQSELFQKLNQFVDSSSKEKIRLSEIQQLTDLVEEAETHDINLVWDHLFSTLPDKKRSDEVLLLARNVAVAWASKTGNEARQAIELLSDREQERKRKFVSNELRQQVLNAWLNNDPDSAVAWVESQEDLPAANVAELESDSKLRLIEHLYRQDPSDAETQIQKLYSNRDEALADLSTSELLPKQLATAAFDTMEEKPRGSFPWEGFPYRPFRSPGSQGSEGYSYGLRDWHIGRDPSESPTYVAVSGDTSATSGFQYGSGGEIHIPIASLLGNKVRTDFDFGDLEVEGIRVDVMSYNLQSGHAKIPVLADEIKLMSDTVDLWGLSEVQNEDWAKDLEVAAENGSGVEFGQILGTTGGTDRLLILFNEKMFEYVDDFELHRINPRVDGRRRVRSALVARLKLKTTGQEFLFMVNHLYRGRANRRHEQAELLNEWGAQQKLPVIAVGDYNFDWEVSGGDSDHDLGYDNFVEDGVFVWVRPDTLVKTQKSDRYDSVLDFVFTNRFASSFAIDSEIIVTKNDIPDTPEISDHRPVYALFSFPTQFEGPVPQFSQRRFTRQLDWSDEDEIDSTDLESLQRSQLIERLRQAESERKEAERLAAGQD